MENEEEEESCFEGCIIPRWYFYVFDTLPCSVLCFLMSRLNVFMVVNFIGLAEYDTQDIASFGISRGLALKNRVMFLPLHFRGMGNYHD